MAMIIGAHVGYRERGYSPKSTNVELAHRPFEMLVDSKVYTTQNGLSGVRTIYGSTLFNFKTTPFGILSIFFEIIPHGTVDPAHLML